MFSNNRPCKFSIQKIYDKFGRISSSIEAVNRHYSCDYDSHHKDYKEIISVTNSPDEAKSSPVTFAMRFQMTYSQYLLDQLVTQGILEHEKMMSYKNNISKIQHNDENQLKRYMDKILIACGQETDFHRTFKYTLTYDPLGRIVKKSYSGLPISFKQPSPDEYKAYASSCNFFARKHKIDEGSGFILSLPLLNMICGYLAYYNEIISAITPGYCNLQPGFLLTWNNHHCDSKDTEQTDKPAFGK